MHYNVRKPENIIILLSRVQKPKDKIRLYQAP